jgi:hypothetical protein
MEDKLMKCVWIRIEEEDRCVRVRDDVAHELVRDNRAQYAPKSQWKEMGREYHEPTS